MSDNNKRSYSYRIDPQSVDFMKRATIVALGNYILDTAGEDADKNGFGIRDLNAHNASWVLTRMAIEVRRMPEEYEDIKIHTWVSEVGRVMTTRNFEIRDTGGNILAVAVSNWAMIDLSSRRPLDLHTLGNYEGMTQPFPVPLELPRKLGTPDAGTEFRHKVVYSDLDFNCHTNSMKYLQWVVDTVPIELLGGKCFTRIDINFIKESRYGDELTVSYSADEDYLFEIRNDTGNAICRIAFRLE